MKIVYHGQLGKYDTVLPFYSVKHTNEIKH